MSALRPKDAISPKGVPEAGAATEPGALKTEPRYAAVIEPESRVGRADEAEGCAVGGFEDRAEGGCVNSAEG